MSNSASARVKIPNRLGLHARPATMFAEVAGKYSAEVTVRRCDQNETVDGKSIMQLMMLAATQGTEIEITAKNDDCQDALRELIDLIKSGFQED